MSNQAKITLSYPQAIALLEVCDFARNGFNLSSDAEKATVRIAKTIGPRMMNSARWRNRWLEYLKTFEEDSDAP